jgi:hypothetical protein
MQHAKRGSTTDSVSFSQKKKEEKEEKTRLAV